jgi:hypothetical protein
MRPSGMPVQAGDGFGHGLRVDADVDQRVFALQLFQFRFAAAAVPAETRCCPRRTAAAIGAAAAGGVGGGRSMVFRRGVRGGCRPARRLRGLRRSFQLSAQLADLATSSFSCFQRSSNCSIPLRPVSSAAAAVRQLFLRGRRPLLLRAAGFRCQTRSCSMRRRQSSIGGGVAVWLSPIRAQVVSSTLTALSGNWRPEI